MTEELIKLKDDDYYYGEGGKKYLSNSDIRQLLTNPNLFRKKKEYTRALLFGKYFHTSILEPEKKDNPEFWSVDASTRNTNRYREAVEHIEGGLLMLNKEKEEIDNCVKAINSNIEFCDSIYDEDNEFEVPAIVEIGGVKWKGKADIVCKDFLIDLKTTYNIRDFKWSAKKQNYDSQAYVYQQLFDKPLIFYVVDKKTLELGIFNPSEDFLESGRLKVEKAIEVYNKFFSKEATHDINTYIHYEVL